MMPDTGKTYRGIPERCRDVKPTCHYAPGPQPASVMRLMADRRKAAKEAAIKAESERRVKATFMPTQQDQTTG